MRLFRFISRSFNIFDTDISAQNSKNTAPDFSLERIQKICPVCVCVCVCVRVLLLHRKSREIPKYGYSPSATYADSAAPPSPRYAGESAYGRRGNRESPRVRERECRSARDRSPRRQGTRWQQQKNLEGYVGFANLPNQVYRKSVKRGFEFTLMVVGESGLGKSTLINSLFLTDLYSAEYPGPSHRIKKTVQVEQSKVLVKEGGVQLLLTIVDTPGFGDAVDNSNCWQPVINHIDSKFEDYLNSESRVNRRQMPDNRVHCCLYFIAPSGHGLKPLDIEFMKRLHEKVNIIPLIAKADTLTPEECQQFKKQIMREIQEHKIKIYEFPETDDEEENKLVKKIKDRLPLAVVGSNTIIEVNGKRARGRQYPWGVAEVENSEHCDFTILRNMLIRTHMQDLKDVTNNVHYENYRSRKLAAVTYNGMDNNKSKGQLTKSPLAQMEEERREHVAKMKKMENEMEQVFEMKVKEKIQKLKDSEAELQRRHEQMKKNLEAQHKELEEKRRQFEEEKANWEAQQRILEQQKLDASRTLEKNKKKKIF
uniref:Septin-7 n=1 Tax=Denticeps clupeoides TaxID=299321 RepID=A0AAY4ETQ5_9TELE